MKQATRTFLVKEFEGSSRSKIEESEKGVGVLRSFRADKV
jgi:hypothetical protein